MKRKITREFLSVILLSIMILIVGGLLIVKNNMNDITELNLNN